MQRRYNLAHFILASVVALVLTLLMVCVDAQARIAFMSDRKGRSEIYVMDADGGNPKNLTNNNRFDEDPSWSPDGKRIVFVAFMGGNIDIYVMNADGDNQRRLTHHDDVDYNPSWSPMGDNQQRLTENRKNDWNPSWSPDGKRIAFSSDRKGDIVNFEIYVMDADGGNQQRLTENRVHD